MAKTPSAGATPWRDRPFLSIQNAAELCACSAAKLYGMEKAGLLTFKRLGGKTLIATPSLIAYLDTAEAWVPSKRAEKATAAARKASASAWAE